LFAINQSFSFYLPDAEDARHGGAGQEAASSG